MVNDLQKAGLWKRIAAFMFDAILLSVLAVGLAFIFSLLLGYDKYSAAVSNAYQKYENQFDITFDISTESYEALSHEKKQNYDTAYNLLINDEDALYAYNMTVNLSLIIVSSSILLAVMIWEFFIPLLLGDGRTLGKKIFGLCIIKTNTVRINNMQLLVRALLGKFTIEIMIPVYAVMMLIFGTLNMLILLLIAALIVAQIISVILTDTNSPIHDLLAGTAVVDAASQMIFGSEDELLEFKKKQHLEHIAHLPY